MRIRRIYLPIPSCSEGRRPSSRTLGGERWTLRLSLDEARLRRTAKTCGPDAATLASMHLGAFDFPGRNGGKRAVLRGEHVISRKAIAQGMSDVLRCPVCSCAHFLCTLRMRPRVQRASGIPCALCLSRGREVSSQNSGASRRGNAESRLPSLRGALATKQSSFLFCSRPDCFAEPVIGRAFARPGGSQ